MRHLTALVLVSLSGCAFVEDQEPPASVGTFAVQGTVEQNTCGFAAMPMPSTYEVNAELSGLPGGAATWRWESQGTTVNGSVTTTGVYRFTTTRQMLMIPADPFYEIRGCTLEERSEVSLTVTPMPMADDAGIAPIPMDADGGVGTRTLSGTYTVDMYPTPGSDCSALLGANGGNFQAIPCQAKSKLTGTLVP